MNSNLLRKLGTGSSSKLFPQIKHWMLTALTSALVIGSTPAVLAATYKTLSNQVVVTGLQPKTKYPVQTTNFSDLPWRQRSRYRGNTRTVTTNSCGEAIIINGTGYRRLIINKQTITPTSLPTQSHPRCNPKRNSRENRQQPINN